MRDAVVIDKNGQIISGNHRKKAATKKGITKERIIEASFDEIIAIQYNDIDLDTPEGKELALALNQTAKFNINIDETLAIEELGEVVEEWGIEIPEEIPEASEDDFDTTPPENPITVLGDLYEIGEHRLLCGDSTDSDAVAKLMNGQKADMCHTDPPYNIDYEGGSKKREKISNDNIEDFTKFLYDAYTTISTALKNGGSIYVWHAPSETHNFIQQFLNAGFLFKSYIIWNKNNSTFGRADYHWKHESCIYGWLDGASHNWYGDRKQTTVWDIERPSRSNEHPTMKPIPLCSIPIENSSKQGDIIIDVFLGSGSTMVAAHQLKRKCYGMELDPKYCDVIVKRMMALDKNITVKRNGVDCKSEFIND